MMEELQKFLAQVKCKAKSNLLLDQIEDLKKSGKDCFRVSQICVRWSALTKQSTYAFRDALEAYLYE